MPLELYPLRYRDPLVGRWIRSRYKAERHIDRFVVGLFLRRYVAYCAWRRHYAQMQGAARLWRELGAH